MVEKKWAFLIGIDKYDELNPFDYCARHVKDIKEILIEEGYPEKNIKILPDQEGKPVSRSDIMREFPRFLWEMEEEYNHTFLIYFIGHGAYHESLYLLTTDSLFEKNNPKRAKQTGININWFEEEMSRFQFQTWNVFMIVDACQSNMLKSHGEDDEDIDEEEVKKHLASLPTGISYFYSCKPLHKGYSFKEKDKFNSVFSTALIESLKTLPKPIRFADVIDKVKTRTYQISNKYGKAQQYPFTAGDMAASDRILFSDELSEESIQERTPITQKPELITQKLEIPKLNKKQFEAVCIAAGKEYKEEDYTSKELAKLIEILIEQKAAEELALVGEMFISLEEYEDALKCYEKAIEFEKKKPYFYSRRGNIYQLQKDFEKAKKSYNQAIELKTKNAYVYKDRGTVNYELNQLVEALADYNKAIMLDEKNAHAYYGRGNVYRKMNQLVEALADYNKAIVLNEKDARPYYNRGTIYYMKKQDEKALVDYNKAIELDENYVHAYCGRGVVYDRMNLDKKALADYNKAIELDEKDAWPYFYRGNVYFKMNQLVEALADYTEAIKLDENYAIAYLNRGYTYYKMNLVKKALADYNKAIELDENYALVYYYRANVYYKMKQNEKALENYKKAIKLDPRVLKGNLKHDIQEEKLFPTDLASTILSYIDDIYDSFSEEEKKAIEDVKKRIST